MTLSGQDKVLPERESEESGPPLWPVVTVTDYGYPVADNWTSMSLAWPLPGSSEPGILTANIAIELESVM